MKTGAAQMRKSKKHVGLAGILARLVLVALMVYAGITLYNLQGQIRSAAAQQAQLSAQVTALQDENSALRADIAAAGEQEMLEEVARDKLGMVKSGEKVFYD